MAETLPGSQTPPKTLDKAPEHRARLENVAVIFFLCQELTSPASFPGHLNILKVLLRPPTPQGASCGPPLPKRWMSAPDKADSCPAMLLPNDISASTRSQDALGQRPEKLHLNSISSKVPASA